MPAGGESVTKRVRIPLCSDCDFLGRAVHLNNYGVAAVQTVVGPPLQRSTPDPFFLKSLVNSSRAVLVCRCILLSFWCTCLILSVVKSNSS